MGLQRVGHVWATEQQQQQRVRKYKDEPEMKNTISEMENAPEGIKCRLDDTEEMYQNIIIRSTENHRS